MKELYCYSDIGSCLVGDEKWSFAVPNIGGDGITKIYIFDDRDEFRKYESEHHINFISTIQGTFNIFMDDTGYKDEDVEIIETLTGRYAVYNGFYKVIFVKWE